MRVLPSALGLLLLSSALCAQPLTDFTPQMADELRARLSNADLAAGEAYFARKCATCHDAAADGIDFTGPLLWQVLGRPVAARTSFSYSKAMQALQTRDMSWDYATLDYYLKDTKAALPGRAMNFSGVADAQQRADLILYLRSLSAIPQALP
ncbi:c-type cytochrome [Atopomonas sediminilitoris]|uniref:c-type cytochrome n=1 Tax=Atopomonas sediminilitoris TaxID=2919919 RepID=UPI001F4D7AA6|nr:c-type cytochrome [Atopomonas sediminilitoris]MCJ8168191.1 c-type cytochrome [Atopomonas sediminilitoris]